MKLRYVDLTRYNKRATVCPNRLGQSLSVVAVIATTAFAALSLTALPAHAEEAGTTPVNTQSASDTRYGEGIKAIAFPGLTESKTDASTSNNSDSPSDTASDSLVGSASQPVVSPEPAPVPSDSANRASRPDSDSSSTVITQSGSSGSLQGVEVTPPAEPAPVLSVSGSSGSLGSSVSVRPNADGSQTCIYNDAEIATVPDASLCGVLNAYLDRTLPQSFPEGYTITYDPTAGK